MEVLFHAAQEGQHLLAESTDPWITTEMLPRGCLLCGQAAHAHTDSVSPCSEQKTSLGAAVVCTEDQALMKKAALGTGAILDLTTGWSVSASLKYWET